MMTIDQLEENARRMAERRAAIKEAEAAERMHEHAPLPPPYCKFCGCRLRSDDYVSVPSCTGCALQLSRKLDKEGRHHKKARTADEPGARGNRWGSK